MKAKFKHRPWSNLALGLWLSVMLGISTRAYGPVDAVADPAFMKREAPPVTAVPLDPKFEMQLVGVGGGRVLCGATSLPPSGTGNSPSRPKPGTKLPGATVVEECPKEGLQLVLDFRPNRDSGMPSRSSQNLLEALKSYMSKNVCPIGEMKFDCAESSLMAVTQWMNNILKIEQAKKACGGVVDALKRLPEMCKAARQDCCSRK